MKIIHFCMNAPFTEGYSYQDNLLPEYQQKHGNEVVIVTSTRTRGEDGKITFTKPGKKKLDNGVDLIRLQTKNKYWIFFGIYPGLNKILKAQMPDLIFIHGLSSFIPAQAIAYKKKHPGVKIVADSHQDTGTTYVNKTPFRQMLWLFRQYWKLWIKNVDRVYGTTSWRVSFMQKYYGIPQDKADTLIMGVDVDHLPRDREKIRREIREKYGIPQESFLYITGGKLDHSKKTIETLKAFTKNQNQENQYLLVFGSVSEDIKDDFRSIISQDKRIIYIGYVESSYVGNLFLASDFGLFPGRHSVLWEEAIGCGLPCVFHRYESRDHTEVCDNCICLTNADVEQLHQIIMKYANQKEEYFKIKKAAMAASLTFSYHAIADKSLECLKER